jgi:hypothetical protein
MSNEKRRLKAKGVPIFVKIEEVREEKYGCMINCLEAVGAPWRQSPAKLDTEEDTDDGDEGQTDKEKRARSHLSREPPPMFHWAIPARSNAAASTTPRSTVITLPGSLPSVMV